MPTRPPVRRLVVVLGDQLNADSSAFDGFDKQRDVVWMAEVEGEAKHVWSHKARIAVFLSGMRHFCQRLRRQGITVHYRELDDHQNLGSLAKELSASLEALRPERIVLVQPGAWRVQEAIADEAARLGIPLDILDDRHFLCTNEEFAQHASSRKQLRQEYFYREMRRKHNVLMEGNKPLGGQWNFDRENRKSFDKHGPGSLPSPRSFQPDKTTKDVLSLVNARFADHPGDLGGFDWPVNARQAQHALTDFIENRLCKFGTFQDAMWTKEPYLYHSRLSVALNLKLLNPRDVIEAAVAAFEAGRAPLHAVEGFVRQILGWREYVRGIYWHFMPEYLERNTFAADRPLPQFYWTGETEMNCLREVICQTLEYGYAHHIQRLMVTGLFALLLGVNPQEVHQWYLAVYVDAVEWVELPNTLGMSQFADHGTMASKPYVATGRYIDRMSNYCEGCRYRPDKATGETACPFTTLYWDFLSRNEQHLAAMPRMVFSTAKSQGEV